MHSVWGFQKIGLLYLQEQCYPVLQVHAGSFHLSIIHQTLTMTWTTGSLMCIHDHSYACLYTWGLGTLMSQHNIFDSKKRSPIFLVFLTGFEPRVFGPRVRCSTNWATTLSSQSKISDCSWQATAVTTQNGVRKKNVCRKCQTWRKKTIMCSEWSGRKRRIVRKKIK